MYTTVIDMYKLLLTLFILLLIVFVFYKLYMGIWFFQEGLTQKGFGRKDGNRKTRTYSIGRRT